MKFIPIDKMKKLREAAKNGDEKAKLIIKLQLDGKDYGASLDEYFSPKVQPVAQDVEVVKDQSTSNDARLEKFLSDNGIVKGSPDYDESVKQYYDEIGGKPGEIDKNEKKAEELGNKITEGAPIEGQETERDKFENIIKDLMKEESKAIDDYSKAITEVMNMPEFNAKQMKRAIARFNEIRDDETEHFNELKALLENKSEEEL